MTIYFGYIDPIEEIRGVKSRVKNLGFYDSGIEDELTPGTSAAIAEFQRCINFPADGELTTETRQALAQVHGS